MILVEIYFQYTANKTFQLCKYQSFGIHISKETVEQPYCLVQNTIFLLKILTLAVYSFPLVYPHGILRS